MVADATLRPVRLPDDRDLLVWIYASTRTAELQALGWSEAQIAAFVQMQYNAQSTHYDEWYPDAERLVIVIGNRAVGRLIVDRRTDGIDIIDIALLPQFRRGGLGSQLVRQLFDEADSAGLAVRCQVEIGNPARAFWEHLGMVAQGLDGAHIAMERACLTLPR